MLNVTSGASYPANESTVRMLSILCWAFVALILVLWIYSASFVFVVPAVLFGSPALILGLSLGSEAQYLAKANSMLRAEADDPGRQDGRSA